MTNNILIILGTLVLFGVVHSLTAGPGLKRWMQRIMDERLYHGTYRLLYNAFSLVTFAPALLAVALLPDQTIYSVPLPWAGVLFALQALSALALFSTLLVTDIFEFVGLRQLAALFSGESLPLAPVPFKAGGPYTLVRHPLYLFGLILLWASPAMTVNSLLLNLGTTAYLVIGIYPEERKLLALYGEDYRVYRQQVPPLLPWPRPRQQREDIPSLQ